MWIPLRGKSDNSKYKNENKINENMDAQINAFNEVYQDENWYTPRQLQKLNVLLNEKKNYCSDNFWTNGKLNKTR